MQSPFAAALRDLGEIVSSRKTKTRGRDTSVTERDQSGGFHPTLGTKTPRNSEARFDVFGLEYRSVIRDDRTTERTNGTEELEERFWLNALFRVSFRRSS
jgi:hypothetical protein